MKRWDLISVGEMRFRLVVRVIGGMRMDGRVCMVGSGRSIIVNVASKNECPGVGRGVA